MSVVKALNEHCFHYVRIIQTKSAMCLFEIEIKVTEKDPRED